MAELGVDAVLLSVGPDLPYLTGYEAMPLERLTMLVLPVDGDATLVVPRLEAPRVVERPEVFEVRAWDETDDPVAIVAAGANAASPHHEPGERVIAEGEVVLCDFGGTMIDDDGIGYCSDITRCVHLGEPSPEMAEAYAVLLEAQQAAVAAAVVGTACEEVDATARRIITEAGWGEQFIHRTGHGIGIEEHEDPYIVSGNDTPLEPGHAFSIEPGIYVPGRFGFRLEDIVVAADAGPDPLNHADHDLALL